MFAIAIGLAEVQPPQPSVIFHLAAQALVRRAYDSPRDTFETNVMGTVNVLEAARSCPSVRAVVIVTSDKVYENARPAPPFREEDPLGGTDPYGASKGRRARRRPTAQLLRGRRGDRVGRPARATSSAAVTGRPIGSFPTRSGP